MEEQKRLNPTGYAYPAHLAAALRRGWADRALDPALLPCSDSVELLIDTMYQASLLREESQGVQCRIIAAGPSTFDSALRDGASSLQVLRFNEPFDFTPHQLRKLAGASGYYRSLLAVDCDSGGPPLIWGMVITGTDWVNRVITDKADDDPLPQRLVVHCIGPGHLLAAAGDIRVVESSGGKLLTEGFDPFRSQWLPGRFGAMRANMIQQLEGQQPSGGSTTRLCDSFVRDVAQRVVRRALRLVRTRGHGGMLIYLADADVQRAELGRWLRFRVRFADDDSTLRFVRLMKRLMERALQLGVELGLAEVTYEDFRQMRDVRLDELKGAIIELGHVFADMMSVDGALVLDRGFRLIGFGAEILGDSHVDTVFRALDLEATRSVPERADMSGTRHRSAYRLVRGLPETIAVVVSQDGDVRFIAQTDPGITCWHYLP
ncbi:hypothetical protein Pla175_24290 [Pirellulimonas nuda]|uniref:Probable sensor domain-containing protein n=1 Tax=Pirellulimonas nuda TaxID=2528009 RepID=A0A518DC60_9BACT|nr:hypothetical protein [Pirellulimonas nuda]QDU89043.1 hypothetical protein Pla175_24290 [Pirellulimonas nuda]